MNAAVGKTKDRFDPQYVAASVLLHLLLLPLILLWPHPAAMPSPQEDILDVQIVTQAPVVAQQNQSLLPLAVVSKTGKSRPTETQQPQSASAVPAKPPTDLPTSVKPTHMLSQDVLADRRSLQARLALAQLSPAEQVEQLCNIEAMAQVGHWNGSLHPDRVVAYAMADTQLKENAFSADGAAVHSQRDWYRLKFQCGLTPDHTKVVNFEFTMGDPIPRKDWTEYGLPEEEGELD